MFLKIEKRSIFYSNLLITDEEVAFTGVNPITEDKHRQSDLVLCHFAHSGNYNCLQISRNALAILPKLGTDLDNLE